MVNLVEILHVPGEVIFDRNQPTQPPDIIFSPQDELLEFNADIDKLKVCYFISHFIPPHTICTVQIHCI